MNEEQLKELETIQTEKEKRLKRLIYAVIIINLPVFVTMLLRIGTEYKIEVTERFAKWLWLYPIRLWQIAWYVYIFFLPTGFLAFTLIRSLVRKFKSGKNPVLLAVLYAVIVAAVLILSLALYRFMYFAVEIGYCI